MSPAEYDKLVNRLEERLVNGEGDICRCCGVLNPLEMLLEMRHEFISNSEGQLRRLVGALLGTDGCLDGSCILRDPTAPRPGQKTNGGCNCLKELSYRAKQANQERLDLLE